MPGSNFWLTVEHDKLRRRPHSNPEPKASKDVKKEEKPTTESVMDKKEEKPATDSARDKKGHEKENYKMDGKRFAELMWKYI